MQLLTLTGIQFDPAQISIHVCKLGSVMFPSGLEHAQPELKLTSIFRLVMACISVSQELKLLIFVMLYPVDLLIAVSALTVPWILQMPVEL